MIGFRRVRQGVVEWQRATEGGGVSATSKSGFHVAYLGCDGVREDEADMVGRNGKAWVVGDGSKTSKNSFRSSPGMQWVRRGAGGRGGAR